LSLSQILGEYGPSRDANILEVKCKNLQVIIEKVHSIRAVGSAALNLCLVAEGACDAYFEYGVHIWDYGKKKTNIIISIQYTIHISKNGNEVEVLSEDELILRSRRSRIGQSIDSISTDILPTTNTVTNSQLNLHIIDFNDLHIGDTIGVGGFGHVFHGKFGDIDVAIKTAKSFASFCSIQTTTTYDDTSDAVQKTLIDSLLREARLFSNLKHRNIIQLFGVSPSLSTKNLYLVMEYAHGGALNYLLRQRQSGLYPNVFIQYAKQIADGMKYLHEEACEHIIHRDLKCSNILILEHINDVHDDSDLLQKTLKITDFGLARKQLQTSSVSTAGTFAWMSPECIRNTEFSTKSDVW
ncbi:unnamed protein product, partial [Rotaria sordida]